MATVIGWYKERVGKAICEVRFSCGWSRHDVDTTRLTLMAWDDGPPRRALRIELSYREAQTITERWAEYMREHPSAEEK